ncbi:MAG: hypothetical protein LBC60_05455 [Spirochaetaceae bacterium]|nr:hypothetical protein [Spirochaetaceae bacterium]
MTILTRTQKKIGRGINALLGKITRWFHRPKKPVSPLADRLLADALRLAEIPSPTRQEEQRVAFVLERLNSLGFVPRIDENGNVLVRIHSAELVDEPPLLLFTDLGSSRWHPLESLSRLDAAHAAGAGLGDVLGAAALLSVAETIAGGRNICCRDLLLLFAARSFDDPKTDVFYSVTEIPLNRPCAAIGIRGFTLGSIRAHTQGTYRITISFSLDTKKERESPESPDGANIVVEALLSIVQKLSRITADHSAVHFYTRRLEAGTGFGRTPSEGLLEIELESSDASRLDEIRNQVTAAAESAGEGKLLKTTVTVTSFIPVGDPAINADLLREVREIMKELRIKINEENGSDPSAFLSHQGIPALSLGMVNGQEGLLKDNIEIGSIEKGRLLLERIITQVPKEKT